MSDCKVTDPDMPVPLPITTSPIKSVPTGEVARALASIQNQETVSILQDEWWRRQGDIHSNIPWIISFIIARLVMYDTGLAGDLALNLWFIVGFPCFVWTSFPRKCYEYFRRLPSDKGYLGRLKLSVQASG